MARLEVVDWPGRAFEQLMDPVAVCAPVRTPDGRVVDLLVLAANEHARRALALQDGHPVGRRVLDLVPRDTVRRVLDWAGTAGPNASLHLPDVRIGDPGDAAWRSFDLQARGIGGGAALFIWREGTAQQRDLEALEQREAHYRLLAESGADVVLRTDMDYRIRYVSPSVRALLGWRPQELIGRLSTSLVHPDDQAAAGAAVQTLRRDGRIEPSFHARLECKDGTYRWTSSTAHVATGPDGEPTDVIATWRDAEQEKALLQDLTQQASTDNLTGLLTRREGWSRLGATLAADRRSDGW